MQIRQPPFRAADVFTLTDAEGDGLTVTQGDPSADPPTPTEIAVYIPATVTAMMRPGQSVFDVEVYDPNDLGEVESLFGDNGKVVVLPEVIR